MYSVKQVAVLLSRSGEYVRRECRKREAGKFPDAKKNGDWRIPQCCLDGHGEASGLSEEELNQRAEVARLTKDTELLTVRVENTTAKVKEYKANRALKLAEMGLHDVKALEEAQNTIEPREQALARREEELRQLLVKVKAEREEWKGIASVLKQAKREIDTYRERFVNDCRVMGRYHKRLEAAGAFKVHSVKFPGLEFSEEVYRDTLSGINWDTLPEI